MSTTRQRNTYLCAKYRRIAARRGKLKAIVAVWRASLFPDCGPFKVRSGKERN
jgi:hypothetical protein